MVVYVREKHIVLADRQKFNKSSGAQVPAPAPCASRKANGRRSGKEHPDQNICIPWCRVYYFDLLYVVHRVAQLDADNLHEVRRVAEDIESRLKRGQVLSTVTVLSHEISC